VGTTAGTVPTEHYGVWALGTGHPEGEKCLNYLLADIVTNRVYDLTKYANSIESRLGEADCFSATAHRAAVHEI